MGGRSLAGRLTFNVGVTGHRVIRLDPGLVEALPPVVDTVLTAIRDAAIRLQAAACIADAPDLWLDSAIATGADQMVAISGRRLGYKVRAVLPFAAALYREDFAAGAERAQFDAQLALADAVLALSCARDGSDAGYVMAGKTIVAAADVLVAVWDGDDNDPSAEGGTAHVVTLALQAEVPVIHILVDRTARRIGPVMLRTGGAPSPLCTGADYEGLLRRVLAADPPITG